MLLHAQRLVLALRLFPVRFLRDAAHFIPRVGDRLEAAILRVRAAGLERHHERLPGGVHHRVRDQERRLVDAIQDLERDADPCLRPGLAPRCLRLCDRREQRVDVRLRIGDAQIETERRAFAPDLADRTRLVEIERLVAKHVELRLRLVGSALAVVLRAGRFRIGGPVPAFGYRLKRSVERCTVLVEKVMRHGGLARRIRKGKRKI